MPNKWRIVIIVRGHTKFGFTVDQGKGRLNPSRDKSSGKHRRRKVGGEILCDPGWCVHNVSDVQNEWDDNTPVWRLFKFSMERRVSLRW